MAETITRRVPLGGGRVESPSGDVMLDVPAGAFPGEVDVTVEEAAPESELMRIGGRTVWPLRVVKLGAAAPDGRPLGGVFARPVRLTMRFAQDDLRVASDEVRIYGRATAADPWQAVPTTVDPAARLAVAELAHFSDYMEGIDTKQAILPTVDGYRTDLCMGSATVSIPLEVPPGTNGMQPKLELTYTSAAVNGLISESFRTYQQAQASWVGMGWSLDLGYIELEHAVGRGRLVLNGRSHQLIKSEQPGQGGRWHTQVEGYLVIRQIDEMVGSTPYVYFRVQDTDGTEYRFGYEPAGFVFDSGRYYRVDGSRQDNYFYPDFPNNPNLVHHRADRWYLDQVRDPHGNLMEVKYRSDDGPSGGPNYDKAIYPTEVHYTVNPDGGLANAQRKVYFVASAQGARQDAPGLQVEETRYLTEVRTEVLEGGSWRVVRKYVFGYEHVDYAGEGPGGRKFLVLRTLDELDGAGNALPRKSFMYTPEDGWLSANSPEGRPCPLPLLTKVENGYGGEVEYAYVAKAWMDFGGGATRRTRQLVVGTTTVRDGLGGATTTTYAGGAPAWTTKFSDTSEYPVFRGFNVVTVTEPTGHRQEHRFFRGLWDGTNNEHVSYANGEQLAEPDHESYKGRAYEVRYLKAATESGPDEVGREWTTPKLLGATPHKPGDWTSADKRDWFVYRVGVVETRSIRGSAQTKTTFAYDGYGNLTERDEYANAADAGWTRRTKRYFFPNDQYAAGTGTKYVVGKVAAEDVIAAGGAVERSTLYLYDGSTRWDQKVGTGVDGDDGSFRGRLTTVRRVLTNAGAGQLADTAFDHDGFGNVRTETRYAGYGTWAALATAGPRVTRTFYNHASVPADGYHAFPLRVENALGHAVTRTFDPASGKPRTVTDANGQVTTMAYDGFQRLTQAYGPNVGSPSYRKELLFDYGLPVVVNGRTTTRVWTRKRSDGGATTPEYFNAYQFYDGTGKLAQEYSDGWDGATVGHTVVNRLFDGRGLVVSQGTSRFVTGLNGAFAEADWASQASHPRTQHSYDCLKRPLVTTHPEGHTTEARYDGWETLGLDRKGHARRHKRDGLGRVAQVVEYTGASPSLAQYAVTTYTHDALDRLVAVSDHFANPWSISYDKLGRKTAMTDPDMGTWGYEYDPLGNLTKQTDARAKFVELRYDSLDRLTSKWHPVEWTEGTVAAGPSQGPRSSTIEADGGDGHGGPWSNPSWIRAVDGADASHAAIGPFEYSNSLRATGFGFSLPAGAVVRGIECVLSNVYETGGGGAVSIRWVGLIKGGTIQGDLKLASTPLITAPGPTLKAGGATDLWGLTLTKADVEASSFGVAFQFQAGGVPGGCGLNAMRLIVHYTAPGEGASRPTVHDLVELRAAVEVDHAVANLAAPTWTDAEMVAGLSPRIRATHFNELRSRIQALWTAAGLGAVPGFTGGAIVGSTRRIKATDLTDLRAWLTQYESAAVNARARAVYRYDAGGAAAFAVGRRSSMLDGSGTSAWLHDAYGRVTRADRTTDGTLYRHGYTHDALDRVRTHAYPDDGGVETLAYAYGANTLLAGLSSSLGVSLASGVRYNHLNMPTQVLLGGGPQATARYSYWGANLDGGAGAPAQPYGALKQVLLQFDSLPPPLPSPALVDRVLSYDPAGNVTEVADQVEGETIAYGYDDLDRLTSAGVPVNESYGYDAVGNMTNRNGLPLAYGDPNHKHAVTAHGGVNYAYDACGNMTSRGSTAFQYSAENRLSKVTAGSTICRYTYDGDGARSKRLDANGTVHYAGDYERNVGAGDGNVVVTKYYRALGRLVAFRRGGVLHWVGSDHLGGTVRTLDASFTVLDSVRYKPYGSDRDAGADLRTDRKFTGQTEDAVAGLYFYKSRYYDPALGRFVQPDTLVPDLGNPQSLNRYAYVLNNPLRFTDPTGHQAVAVLPLAGAGAAGVAASAAAPVAVGLAIAVVAVVVLDAVFPDTPYIPEDVAMPQATGVALVPRPWDANQVAYDTKVGGRKIRVHLVDHHPRHGHILDGDNSGDKVELDTGRIYDPKTGEPRGQLRDKDLDVLKERVAREDQKIAERDARRAEEAEAQRREIEARKSGGSE